RDLRRHHC
ncbi:N-acetylglucosamine-6-phosphate deacetylase, partial [Vibrio parahaemolyticus VPTS-2010]